MNPDDQIHNDLRRQVDAALEGDAAKTELIDDLRRQLDDALRQVKVGMEMYKAKAAECVATLAAVEVWRKRAQKAEAGLEVMNRLFP